MLRKRFWAQLFTWVLLCSGFAFAQVTTGTISGIVKDSTGAVVPGAALSAKNTNTGITRTTTTDASGRYRVPELMVGDYEVTAAASGFQTAERTGITMTVGREAVVDFTLQVGAVAEKITVSGEAPIVETSNATVANLVNEREMRDLPLNGRSYADLTAIQPGVVSNIGVASSVFTGGPRISINGARAQQSLYLLDGMDIVSPYENVTPVSVLNELLGVDAIREFSVLRNNFGAQYGRALGGVINAVTRSGGNDWHGGAFEFLRNSALDAKNFFDRHDLPIPPFKRNQFGGSLGGPIVKDKTFLFLSYEGLRQRLGLSVDGFTPTVEARTQGIIRDKSGNITSTVPVNPDIVPFLNLLALPNLPTQVGGGLGEFRGSLKASGGENYGVMRIDHQLGGHDSLFGRFTIDDSSVTTPLSYNMPGGYAVADQGGYRFATLSETHIFSSSLLNTLSFGFARNNNAEADAFNASGLDPRLSAVAGDPLITVNAPWLSYPNPPGRTPIGHDLNNPLHFVDDTFGVTDNVTYTRGRHSLILGGNVTRYRMDELISVWRHGFLFFSDLPSLLAGKPFQDTTTLPNPDTNRGWRQTYWNFYAQDDLKVLPQLTVNLGLRWERVTNPAEVHGKISILRNPLLDSTFVQPNHLFELRDALKGFAPRFGLAWTPFPGGKTVVRTGFGFFREIPLEYMYQLAVYDPPFAGIANLINPPFPFPLTAASATSIQPLILDPHFKYPYAYQYNFGVEQQLSGSVVVKAAYVGTRSLNLPALNNPNQPIPQLVNGRWFTPGAGTNATSPQPNPNFVAIRYISNLGNAWYNSLQTSVEKRFSHGLQFNVSYTWAKNIDSIPIGLKGAELIVGSGNQNIQNVSNVYDLAADKSLSQLDSRHSFVFSYSYELPFGAGKTYGSALKGVAGKLAGGWQLNGILTTRTGLPQTALLTFNNSRSRASVVVDRPDLAPGKSNNPVLGGPNHYFDPSSFALPPPGFFGNAGRNTITQPRVFSWDLSIFKRFSITERQNLEFRAELFNLLNHPNFAGANTSIFSSASGAINPAAGVITLTSTASRQLQLGLRFIF